MANWNQIAAPQFDVRANLEAGKLFADSLRQIASAAKSQGTQEEDLAKEQERVANENFYKDKAFKQEQYEYNKEIFNREKLNAEDQFKAGLTRAQTPEQLAELRATLPEQPFAQYLQPGKVEEAISNRTTEIETKKRSDTTYQQEQDKYNNFTKKFDTLKLEAAQETAKENTNKAKVKNDSLTLYNAISNDPTMFQTNGVLDPMKVVQYTNKTGLSTEASMSATNLYLESLGQQAQSQKYFDDAQNRVIEKDADILATEIIRGDYSINGQPGTIDINNLIQQAGNNKAALKVLNEALPKASGILNQQLAQEAVQKQLAVVNGLEAGYQEKDGVETFDGNTAFDALISTGKVNKQEARDLVVKKETEIYEAKFAASTRRFNEFNQRIQPFIDNIVTNVDDKDETKDFVADMLSIRNLITQHGSPEETPAQKAAYNTLMAEYGGMQFITDAINEAANYNIFSFGNEISKSGKFGKLKDILKSAGIVNNGNNKSTKQSTNPLKDLTKKTNLKRSDREFLNTRLVTAFKNLAKDIPNRDKLDNKVKRIFSSNKINPNLNESQFLDDEANY